MALSKTFIRENYATVDDFFDAEAGKHYCQCGCEEIIILKRSHFWNGIPQFIFGHAAKIRNPDPDYDHDKYYSIRDIAEKSKVSEQTVRLWARKYGIHPIDTAGRKNLYDKQRMDEFLVDRPRRKPFDEDRYISVPELKQIGVSRSKLRALVRKGLISEPRVHSRKTNYLKSEIDHFFDQIKETPQTRVKNSISTKAFKRLQEEVQLLEKRVRDLENKAV